MNIGIYMGHPAHFHNLKNLAANLQRDGYNVFFLIKEKDILEDLMCDAGLSYTLTKRGKRNNKLQLLWSMIHAEYDTCKFIRKHKIDLLFGTTFTFATRMIMHRHVVLIGEDDASVVPLMAHVAFPYANQILSPTTCDNGRWNKKTIHYPGYQKLAYLHPKRFTADRAIVEKYGIDTTKPYFIIRFAKLGAHHDVGVHGFTTEIAQRVIGMISPIGRVYITSEKPLPAEFEQYRLQINPLDIHHVMAFATLYMGDSQSMAVEAAMLGVPSIRFNDFVGTRKIGVLEELEHKYGLTFAIPTSKPQLLYDKISELLSINNLKTEFQTRRQQMLNEKIDVTAFFTWFVENYPQSAILARNADNEFWQQYK